MRQALYSNYLVVVLFEKNNVKYQFIFGQKYELPNQAENGPRTCNFFPFVVNCSASIKRKFIIIILLTLFSFNFIIIIMYSSVKTYICYKLKRHIRAPEA